VNVRSPDQPPQSGSSLAVHGMSARASFSRRLQAEAARATLFSESGSAFGLSASSSGSYWGSCDRRVRLTGWDGRDGCEWTKGEIIALDPRSTPRTQQQRQLGGRYGCDLVLLGFGPGRWWRALSWPRVNAVTAFSGTCNRLHRDNPTRDCSVAPRITADKLAGRPLSRRGSVLQG
jgi:hypothetical protein